MANEREKTVAWVLDFLSMDIEQMSRVDLLKTAIEVQENLFPGVKFLPNLPERGRESLRDIHLNLKEFFETYIHPILMGHEERSPQLPQAPKMKDRFFLVAERTSGKVLSFNEMGDANLGKIARERFIQLLGTGTPLQCKFFQLCEECQRWFFSRRSKRFCAPRCNWKFNARKRRGKPGSKERKAYNLAQANLMKDKYREKVLG